MLSVKELEKVYDILNSKQQTLEKIYEAFHGFFNESLSMFRGSYGLSNLLLLNLLTNQQRIIAIYILYENYRSQPIKKHPFASTLFEISSKTTEPFERKMISDLILDNKKEKYSKTRIEVLFEDEEKMVDSIQEKPQMKKLREQYVINLPKIAPSKKSEVRNVVSDFNQRDKKIYPPENPVNKSSIKQAEISHEGFNIGFLRPIPKFIELSPSELHWLSPGIITDVHWDNTAELQKKLSKTKSLLKKALTNHLTKQQSLEVERVLDTQPYAVLNLGMTPQLIGGLIKSNPFIAVSFLVKVSQYPIIEHYLQALEKAQLGLNPIDVLTRLLKSVKIPKQFIVKYILTVMKQSINISENHKDRLKIPRVVAVFIKSMIRAKIFDPIAYQSSIQQFARVFVDVDEAQSLLKIIKKQ